jgi:serine/threonine protein kinase
LLHLCPTCRRRFDEAGFCPFDGTSLAPGIAADQPTVVSAPMAAQVVDPQTEPPTMHELPPLAAAAPGSPRGLAAHAVAAPGSSQDLTQLEIRHRTFPLTPSPVARGAGGARAAGAASAPAAAGRVAGTGEITTSRTRPGPAASGGPRVRAPSDPPKVEARSASENPSNALELYRTPRENEYDKLIGQTLDARYYVEKKIGEGGMGVVFSARHAVIERPLAIKVLKREAMRDTATIRRFIQEAKAASRIGHPNIVDVTDFGTTPDGMTYSVMEFVPGQTLGTAIRLGAPFTPMRAIRITAQIARALAAAHDKGIVHRDLKPENVFLLDRDGRPDFVKIVDFGIAKVTPPPGKTAEPRLTRAGSVFGTPEYMAPEQAAGRSDTDGRVDIYALGVIFYEMICGRVPHRGDSMVRTLAMQMLDPIEPPSKVRPDLAIAPELEAVVMHALVKKREQRYQTMGELLEALEAVLPPAVAQSVTGSPVYTLAPLPPGADPGVVPSLPAMPLASSEAGPAGSLPGVGPAASAPGAPPRSASGREPARGATTARRVKDEPEFTADDRPLSFHHVFTDDLIPARGRRWPALLLLALISGGAASAVALVIRSHHIAVANRDRDAGVVELPGDAAIVHAPVDAEPDAPDLIVLPEIDAGRVARIPPARDAGTGSGARIPETPNHRGTILVQVLTKPEGANLYDDDHHYRGPGGAEVEEPFGTRRTFTCKQPGYKPGTIEVNFDGSTTAVLCVLLRIKICINGIKNPFDDCEVVPSPPPPGPTTPPDEPALIHP